MQQRHSMAKSFVLWLVILAFLFGFIWYATGSVGYSIVGTIITAVLLVRNDREGG